MRCLLCCIALWVMCVGAYAQADTSLNKPNTGIRICTPSRGQIINPPLYLIFKGTKQLLSTKNQQAFSSQFDVHDILSMNILKGPDAIKKYGDDGQFGAIEVYLKRGKHLIKNPKSQPVDTLTRYRR